MDKFKLTGHEYRKFSNNNNINNNINNNHHYSKLTAINPLSNIPLTAYGPASTCSILCALIGRQFSAQFVATRLAFQLGLMPLFSLFLYSFILPSLDETQNSLQTRSAIIFSLLATITFLVPAITTYNCKCYSQTLVIYL